MLSPDLLRPVDQRVYEILVAAADAGECCPSNSALGARIDGSAVQASDILRRLERRGVIMVARGNNSRLVTIVASGRRTAGPVPEPHWRDRAPDPRQPKPARILGKPPSASDPLSRDENLAARIEADQARLRAEREHWLRVEQERYRLPRRGRLIEEMPA